MSSNSIGAFLFVFKEFVHLRSSEGVRFEDFVAVVVGADYGFGLLESRSMVRVVAPFVENFRIVENESASGTRSFVARVHAQDFLPVELLYVALRSFLESGEIV